MRHSLKRAIAIFLAAVLFAACMPAAFALSDTVPAGYSAIYTPEDLDGIRVDLAGKYILMNDIDLGEWGDWEPIGVYPDGFAGVLDGNGYEIQNLQVNCSMPIDGATADVIGAGLFNVVSCGVVKNLGLVEAAILAFGDGGFYVGGFVAMMLGGEISNCYFSGELSAQGVHIDNAGAGGLVGMVSVEENNFIKDCYSVITYMTPGLFAGGGIVAGIGPQVEVPGSCLIQNCYSNFEPVGFNNNPEASTIMSTVTLTETQLKQQASFTGFDFTTPQWYIQEGESYPKLRPFPEPESPTHFPDEETGITVDAPEGTFDPGTEMQVSEVSIGNFTLGPGNSVHVAYDISFVKDNVTVQPNGSVIVRLPFTGVSPSASANWKVYHVSFDDSGKVTGKVNMNAEVVEIDGKWYWEFEASHFSIYAVVDEQGLARPVLKGDKNITLEYLGKGELAPLVEGEVLTWSGGNDYISVDEGTGKITSNKGFIKTGSATIKATNSEGEVEFNVKVKPTFGQWMMIIFLFGWIWM